MRPCTENVIRKYSVYATKLILFYRVVNVRGSKDCLCVGKAQIKLNYDFSRCDFVIILLEGRCLMWFKNSIHFDN